MYHRALSADPAFALCCTVTLAPPALFKSWASGSGDAASKSNSASSALGPLLSLVSSGLLPLASLKKRLDSSWFLSRFAAAGHALDRRFSRQCARVLQALVSRIFQDRIAAQRQQENMLQSSVSDDACIYCNLADTIAALGASTRRGAALSAAAAAASCQYKDQLESLLMEHQHVLSRLAVRFASQTRSLVCHLPNLDSCTCTLLSIVSPKANLYTFFTHAEE